MIQFRGFTPSDRDQLVSALGSKIAVQESVWNCSIQAALNRQKKPFDDERVRRALTLALDRWNGSKALSRIAIVKEVSGIQVPGTPWATPPEELEKLAGYGRDVNAARAQARRLLKEAGQENLTFTLTNRAVPMPYEPIGVWLIDQWRQIGVNVKQVTLESAAWFTAQKEGRHEVSTNAPCNSIPEPDLDLHWFRANSPANYGRHKDAVMDDLYRRQSRTTDPDERRKLLRQFEKRLYDEEVHFIHTFAWHRIIPHLAKVRGWTITPSHFLNQQLDTVWLSESGGRAAELRGPSRPPRSSRKHHSRGADRPVEGPQDEAQHFERDDAEQRLVLALTQDDWRVPIALRQLDVALRDVPLDDCAVGEDEVHAALR